MPDMAEVAQLFYRDALLLRTTCACWVELNGGYEGGRTVGMRVIGRKGL